MHSALYLSSKISTCQINTNLLTLAEIRPLADNNGAKRPKIGPINPSTFQNSICLQDKSSTLGIHDADVMIRHFTLLPILVSAPWPCSSVQVDVWTWKSIFIVRDEALRGGCRLTGAPHDQLKCLVTGKETINGPGCTASVFDVPQRGVAGTHRWINDCCASRRGGSGYRAPLPHCHCYTKPLSTCDWSLCDRSGCLQCHRTVIGSFPAVLTRRLLKNVKPAKPKICSFESKMFLETILTWRATIMLGQRNKSSKRPLLRCSLSANV